MIFPPFGTACTVVRRTVSGQDGYGNDTFTEASTATVCAMAPDRGMGSAQQLAAGYNANVDGPTVYLPTGTDVERLDHITVDGVTYEVFDEPEHWRNPFTNTVGPVLAPVRRLT